ncbi:MAG: formylglycine-generating enzyme family protein [Sphingomonadaceae bacterium]
MSNGPAQGRTAATGPETKGLSPLVTIPAGDFLMGSDNFYPEESPVRKVHVDAFRIERSPVSNARFAAFVEATGYVTVAERPLPADLFPQMDERERSPGSMVFRPTPGPVDLRHLSQWWAWTPGACWHRPTGPGSHIRKRGDHPVVHIAYEDALTYAAWAGRDLPTEAQWERAARGHHEGADFCWGNEKTPGGKRMAKHYEGAFPYANTPSDGHKGSAPVGSYPANDFGLFDMAGNVWEWTTDWYSEASPVDPAADETDTKACCVPSNPRGGTEAGSLDPNQPQFAIPRKVIKGGSYLCADEYCMRYRPAARRPQMIDTGMSHIGFRCIAPAQ